MGKIFCSIFMMAVLSVAMAANEHIPNVEVMYSQKVNLTCMDDNLDPDSETDMIMWLLPNGKLVKTDQTHEEVMLFENGKLIHIKELDDKYFGVYNCIIYSGTGNNMKYHIVQKGINLYGPYWGDLMAKYRTNLIVGAIAAAVVLVIMLGLCFLMNRGHSLDEDESKRVQAADLWVSNRSGYENSGVELDDIEVEPKKVAPVNGDSPPGYSDSPDHLATKL